MADITSAVQDYLKGMHQLGGADRVVYPIDIASLLRVKAPSVTGMLKRLAEAGWVTYASGSGAQLTEAGLAEARRVIRRHRLVELFLTSVLGLDWSEVDAEAEALEHAISPRLEQALADYLGEPDEDPHGHPIPSRTGELPHRNLRRLSEFREGDRVVIREAQDDNPARLRHWQELGLVPGAAVHVRAYQPLDDVYEVEVGGRTIRLGSEGLNGLRGEPGKARPFRPRLNPFAFLARPKRFCASPRKRRETRRRGREIRPTFPTRPFASAALLG